MSEMGGCTKNRGREAKEIGNKLSDKSFGIKGTKNISLVISYKFLFPLSL